MAIDSSAGGNPQTRSCRRCSTRGLACGMSASRRIASPQFTLTNPMMATTLPIAAALAGESLEFTYTRNKAALGELTFAVESSDSPASASWSTAGVTEIILSDNGTAQQIKATLPAGVMRRFVHLSVTRAP